MGIRLFSARGIRAEGKLLPFSDFAPCGKAALLPECREETVRAARAVSSEPLPGLPATLYADFVRDGDRSRFEKLYHGRRAELCSLIFAEAYEGSGEFTDRIVDRVWAILEETTWVVPAHAEGKVRRQSDVLPFAWRPTTSHYIDLFSAATAALLAMTLTLVGDVLDGFSRELRPRILEALRHRAIEPFATRDDMWWMGEMGRSVNNWNPWVLSNLLTVVALTVGDVAEREFLTDRVMRLSDHFTQDYPEDGGCDEGPSYFTQAGACLFDICERLYDMSGGRINVFDEPLLRAIGEYEARVWIGKDYFLNFADAGPILHPSGRMLARFGGECASPLLEAFGASRLGDGTVIHHYNVYRSLSNLTLPVKEAAMPTPAKRVWFEGLRVLLLREKTDGTGLFLGMKGGHNAESHNHNDVGSFVVYADSEPLLADTGNDRYCAATFDAARRYTLWQNTSPYHNLPTLGGCDQKDGREFASYDEKADGDSLALSLEKAYPAEAGLVRYRRTGALRDGAVTVTDEIAFTSPSPVTFHFLAAEEPTLAEGAVLFPSGHRFTLPAGLSVTVEEITLSDYMKERWQRPTLWRINAEKQNVTEATFVFTVK